MSAIFSYPVPTYRYRLDRQLVGSGPPVGFCLHNPSTAGADNDDPTSRRGIGFANSWNASRLTYVNPWAGCATDKADLWKMDDPVGPLNDNHIERVARELAAAGGFMVVAWGAVDPPRRLWAAAMERLVQVETLIANCDCPVMCLGKTSTGAPRHPLYLPKDSALESYP